MDRTRLLRTLEDMPEEAFGWFVLWAMLNGAKTPREFQFPDGLGGFRPESRQSIEALRAAANDYAEQN